MDRTLRHAPALPRNLVGGPEPATGRMQPLLGLTDLEQLLKQTEGTGVDVYTHSEMLPAHYYPAFKKYKHFAGNYGNAWWKQLTEFESFRGPILFTTNCIVPPKSEEIRSRIFTTGASGYPGCKHIVADASGAYRIGVYDASGESVRLNLFFFESGPRNCV